MKRQSYLLFTFLLGAFMLPLSSFSAKVKPNTDSKKDLQSTLISLEKQLWQAWQKHDGKAYGALLADDHIEVTNGGPVNKAESVAFITSDICTIESYKLKKFKVAVLDANNALVTYYVTQESSCNGKPTKPAWVSSLYQKRGGKWLNVVYQQTTAHE